LISIAPDSRLSTARNKRQNKIDFNNLKLLKLTGIIEDFKTLNDTTTFSIYYLGLKESNGFTIKKMNSFRNNLQNRTFFLVLLSLIATAAF